MIAVWLDCLVYRRNLNTSLQYIQIQIQIQIGIAM